MGTKLLHLRIRVKNTEKSIKFYKENFGCNVTRKSILARGNKLTFLSLPGNNAVLGLCEF